MSGVKAKLMALVWRMGLPLQGGLRSGRGLLPMLGGFYLYKMNFPLSVGR